MENHLFNGKTHYTWPFSIATVDVKPPEGKSNVIILMTIFFFRFTAMHFFFMVDGIPPKCRSDKPRDSEIF